MQPGVPQRDAMTPRRRVIAAVCLSALAAGTAQAQDATAPGVYTPRVEAARIERDAAPVIDGDLNDPAWVQAAVIEKFYQVEPAEGAPPSQPTRAYVMYDARNLYVGVYAYDSEPERIYRSLLERDPPIQDDDAVRIIIDSFGTFRDGYFFATNPNGARNDALIENNGVFRDEWDTVWDVAARVVEDGWIAEFRIPFQSISFDASLDAWGFQIVRTIRRDNEEIRWSNIDRTRSRIDLTNPGRLAGVRDVESSVGVETQLFIAGSSSYDWRTDSADYALDPGANIFYKLTPSLTGSLTFNTDFSDAPLDARQVNTGRFSLFFPETRDFFLQDAAVFQFAGRIFADEPNGMPFFTRRIGIVDGRAADILAGAKLSGKAGPVSIGAIAARTGAVGDIDGQLLSAARLSAPVLAESKLGVVFTHGDPAGEAANTLAGIDFQYKNARAWPGTLFADFAYQRSFDRGEEGVGDDDLAAVDIAYRSQRWNWSLALQDIGENYRPRLGFANRTGVRRYDADFWRVYRPAEGFIRTAQTGLYVEAVTDVGDEILDRFWGGWAAAENHAGDSVELRVEQGFLDIRETFDIADTVLVAPGEYRFTQYEVELELTEARAYAAGVEVRWGEIYDGDILAIEAAISAKPSRHVRLAAEYEYSKFSLPPGEVGVHVAALAATFAFSPTISLKTDIQYDNISEEFTLFSRFRWEPTPEREIFLSFGHTAILESERFPGAFRSEVSSLALRFGQRLRF
ncbi:MAG: hypothetical protein Kow00133_09570 [Amphiplicatus sp.]